MNRYFEQKAAAQSFEEYESLVNGTLGASDLMEFLRLDPGAVFLKDPASKAFKMISIKLVSKIKLVFRADPL
jgi:hypothetical protein